MVNLTIRNLPQEVYEALKFSAKQRGRSLNAEVIQVLTEAAEEAERREFIRTSWPELERFVATLPRISSSVPLIREDRKRH